MNLLVLGASGRTGTWVVRMAVDGGDRVTAVLRPGSTADPAGATVLRGDVTDPDFLATAVAGHHAVISCVGLRRAGLSPWARLLSPPDLTTRLASTVARAMEHHAVRRLVVVSAGGVGDSITSLTWPVQQMVAAGNVGVAYRDLAGMEARLAQSSLDWLAVRPVTLVNGRPSAAARPVNRYALTSTIRRADVAQWMLAQARRHDSFIDHTVLLGT